MQNTFVIIGTAVLLGVFSWFLWGVITAPESDRDLPPNENDLAPATSTPAPLPVPDPATTTPPATPPDPTPTPAAIPSAATAAAAAVRTAAASQVGVPETAVTITAVREETWPNGCLGLAEPGEVCTQALISGYAFTVSVAGETRNYRTDGRGATVRPVTTVE